MALSKETAQSSFQLLGHLEVKLEQIIAEKKSRLTTEDGALMLAKEIVEKGGWNPVVTLQFKLQCEADWET
jgi:hypothetical protein